MTVALNELLCGNVAKNKMDAQYSHVALQKVVYLTDHEYREVGTLMWREGRACIVSPMGKVVWIPDALMPELEPTLNVV